MIISSIDSLEQLNQLCSEQFSLENCSNLVPFDMFCAYVINNNLYSQLRNSLEIEPYSNFVANLVSSVNSEQINNATNLATFETYAPVSEGVQYFFYPFSLKDFIPQFFSDVIPDITNDLISLMKSTNRLIQIGGGSGKAFIIKVQPFTQLHFESLPKKTTPQEALFNITSSITSIQSYIQDTQYLYNIIEQKDQLIEQLNNQIQELNNKVLSVYQTTWR